MVVDRLENLERYVSLNPLFAQAVDFLRSTDLNARETGRVVLEEGKLMANFSRLCPKTKEEAKLETHNDFIDIQIPLSGTEIIGYTPRAELPEAAYDAENDISFYEGEAADYLVINPGMFAIFFPEDAHAPGITAEGVKKIIMKVRVK